MGTSAPDRSATPLFRRAAGLNGFGTRPEARRSGDGTSSVFVRSGRGDCGFGRSKDDTAQQRSIRSTLSLLLILPLISLIALWVYAASTTLGETFAKRTADSINHQVGGPTEQMIVQLQAERTATFTWQSTNPRPSEKALAAQRALTDQAVSQSVAEFP